MRLIILMGLIGLALLGCMTSGREACERKCSEYTGPGGYGQCIGLCEACDLGGEEPQCREGP